MAQMPPDQESVADATVITITVNPDSTFSFAVTGDDDSQGDPGDGPQTVGSVDEVIQLVQQELGETDSDPGAAWQQEASGRDASGQRSAPGGGAPSMSM